MNAGPLVCMKYQMSDVIGRSENGGEWTLSGIILSHCPRGQVSTSMLMIFMVLLFHKYWSETDLNLKMHQNFTWEKEHFQMQSHVKVIITPAFHYKNRKSWNKSTVKAVTYLK